MVGEIASLLAGTVLGIAAGRYRWRREPVDYAKARLDAILMVADQLPKGGVLLLGDSLLEHCHFAEPDIINAGAAFAKIAHVAAAAPKLIARTRPRRVFIAVGPNDLQMGEADFERRYSELVAVCKGPPLTLAGIPNQPEASAFIASLADKIGADYFEPIFGEPLTFDAMGHQTAPGRELFKRRVLEAVSEAPALKAMGE